MSTCPACGAASGPDARFCPQCGAPAPGGDVAAPAPAAEGPATDAAGVSSPRNWAVFAHLSSFVPVLLGVPLPFIGPLVLWLIAGDRGAFARDQAAEALNFNLSWLLWTVVITAVAAVAAIPTVLIALIPAGLLLAALAIAWIVLVIVAAVRASSGEWYRYPLTIRFVSAER